MGNSIENDKTEIGVVYEFFPNDEKKLNYVMQIYEQEILNRNKWISDCVNLIGEAMNMDIERKTSPGSMVINYAMTIINHAMLVLRLVDVEAKGSWDKKRSKERALLLHSRNTNFVDPPNSLRDIRNDYEHFEERLDEWATKENPNMYIDLNIGANLINGDFGHNDVFRNLNETKLTFWNNEVDLQEVIDWVGKMSMAVKQNNPGRYNHLE